MLTHLRHWSSHHLARLPSVVPSSCALCGVTSNEPVCHGCHTQFFSRRPVRCRQCATPLAVSGAAICGDCLQQPPAFDATIVATDYTAPVDQLVLALKFGGRLALAPWFGRMLRNALLDTQETTLPSLLTAVPLGAERLAERGFNQALEIAKPLARASGIPLDRQLVVRQHETRPQSMLHPDERQTNIRKAFIVSSAGMERVQGQHIGVVDDVITTGETLNELAATLKRFGAARVTNLVFARTLPR